MSGVLMNEALDDLATTILDYYAVTGLGLSGPFGSGENCVSPMFPTSQSVQANVLVTYQVAPGGYDVYLGSINDLLTGSTVSSSASYSLSDIMGLINNVWHLTSISMEAQTVDVVVWNS